MSTVNHIATRGLPELVISPSLGKYTKPPAEFFAQRPYVHAVLCSAIIFHPDIEAPPRTLLLRRSPTDYLPLLWETPGGGLDRDGDVSILAAAVRELAEETGLAATKAVGCVAVDRELEGYDVEDGGEVWLFGEKKNDRWAKVTFLMEVEGGKDVKIQDEEHVEYKWVSEEEVRSGTFEGEEQRSIDFVSEMVRDMILEAFRTKNSSKAT